MRLNKIILHDQDRYEAEISEMSVKCESATEEFLILYFWEEVQESFLDFVGDKSSF